jgi:hypothetical protein
MKVSKLFESDLNNARSQNQQQIKTNNFSKLSKNENTNSSVKEKIMLFTNVATASNKPPILLKAHNPRPVSQIIGNASKPSQESNPNLLKYQNNQLASSFQSIFKNTPSSSPSSSCIKVDYLSKNISTNLKLNSFSSLNTNTTILPSTTTLTSIETISVTNQCLKGHSPNRPNSSHTTKSTEKKNSFKSVKDKIAYFSSNQVVNSQNKSINGNKNNKISKSIEIISSQVQNAIHIKKTRPKEWDSLKYAYNSNNNENSNELIKSNIIFLIH